MLNAHVLTAQRARVFVYRISLLAQKCRIFQHQSGARTPAPRVRNLMLSGVVACVRCGARAYMVYIVSVRANVMDIGRHLNANYYNASGFIY